MATSLFGAVAQDCICGSVSLVRINDEHNFKLKLNFGQGTKTKDELLSLWCLVKFTTTLGIDTIYIFGDSLVIVN